MSRETFCRLPKCCCVCLAEEKTRIAVSSSGETGAGQVITTTLYVPLCAGCALKRDQAGRWRLGAAIIAGLVGLIVGGLAKGPGAAGGGALLGFVVGYIVVHAVFESVFQPAEFDAQGNPRFKNKEYQAHFDRLNS